MSRPRPRRALYIVWVELAALEAKGVASLLDQRTEGGYFEHAYTAHFPTHQERVVQWSPDHTVLELRGYGAAGPVSTVLLGLRAAWRLARLVREERVDLIRAQDPFHQGLLAWVVAGLTGVPWCVSVHADHDLCWRLVGRSGPKYALARLLRRFVLARAPLVLPISEYLAARCREQCADPRRIRVIHHGIDLTRYQDPTRHAPWWDERLRGRPLLSYVGRLTQEHYVYDVLEVARRVADRRPDVAVVLAGGGPEEAAVRQRVEQLELNEQVLLAGFRSQDEVAALRCRSTVNLCLLGGFSLLEAAASGRPTICYDVEWHRELIADGESGFLIGEGDVDAAAARVLTLLDDPTLAERLGGRARELAFRDYSEQSAFRRRVAAYEELLRARERAVVPQPLER